MKKNIHHHFRNKLTFSLFLGYSYTTNYQMAGQNEREMGAVQNMLLRIIPVPLLVKTGYSPSPEIMTPVSNILIVFNSDKLKLDYF